MWWNSKPARQKRLDQNFQQRANAWQRARQRERKEPSQAWRRLAEERRQTPTYSKRLAYRFILPASDFVHRAVAMPRLSMAARTEKTLLSTKTGVELQAAPTAL